MSMSTQNAYFDVHGWTHHGHFTTVNLSLCSQYFSHTRNINFTLKMTHLTCKERAPTVQCFFFLFWMIYFEIYDCGKRKCETSNDENLFFSLDFPELTHFTSRKKICGFVETNFCFRILNVNASIFNVKIDTFDEPNFDSHRCKCRIIPRRAEKWNWGWPERQYGMFALWIITFV